MSDEPTYRWESGYQPESRNVAVETLVHLLVQEELQHLGGQLKDETLQGCVQLLEAGRQTLMSHFQQIGLRLKDRQALVNALSLALREDRLILEEEEEQRNVDPLEEMSIKQLRALVQSAGLKHADCTEKSMLLDRARAAWEIKQVGSNVKEMMGRTHGRKNRD